MSIAYDFEPDVSPIYNDDDQFTFHSVHFSSADTPRAVGRKSTKAVNKTLGTSHIGQISNIQECRESDNSTSSCKIIELKDLSSTSYRNNIEAISDEVVQDSTELQNYRVLSNTNIVLSAGCCLPIKRQLINNLEEMGANVQKIVDDDTTHIVVDRYADVDIVGLAMKRRPFPPMMVDVKWIQECVDRKEKVEESDYSMHDCRYLKQTCRRLSSFRNDENSDIQDRQNEIEFVDMSYSSPIDFIEEVRLLSERLDALLDHAPIIRYAYHSPDCPTRQKAQMCPPPPPPAPKINIEQVRKNVMRMSSGITIKRRRSFSGFVFEHRAINDDTETNVLQQIYANRDKRDIWVPEKILNSREAAYEMNMINDMRKTVAVDLPAIRETYQKNSRISKKKTKSSKNKEKPPRKMPKTVRIDDSDIQSAMASLTICHSPEVTEDSVDPVRMHVNPVVQTKSDMINRMLLNESCDDFVSDVSAYRQIVRSSRNGVVFTGFNKDSSIEKKLMKIAKRFHLRIQDEVDEKTTKCIVSRHGKRTLLVLKAICSNISVVKPQWLEESDEDSKLLEYHDYLFDDWKEVFDKRKVSRNIFPDDFRIFVMDGCKPEKKDLCWMIEKCGGKITRNQRKSDIIVAQDGIRINIEKDDVPVVTPLFIIDSISQNEYLTPSDYLHGEVINIV